MLKQQNEERYSAVIVSVKKSDVLFQVLHQFGRPVAEVGAKTIDHQSFYVELGRGDGK